MKVVAGIAVKDEEWIIKKNLDVLIRFCDKIIVQNDNGTDRTKDICEAYDKVEWNERPYHEWYIREEGKQRRELFDLVVKHNPDYILLLDADEIVTPSIVNFINNIDTSINLWSIRMINLWGDDKHYRIDSYRTTMGANVNWNPFSSNAWRKTSLMKYNKDFEYKYDLTVNKGPVSVYHPCPDNSPKPHKNTEDFYILHYSKLSKEYLSGLRNHKYSKMEAYEGRGEYNYRLKRHESCRLEGNPVLKKINKEWMWEKL